MGDARSRARGQAALGGWDGAMGLASALPARQSPCGSGEGGPWERRGGGGCLRQVALPVVLYVRLD